MQALFTVRLLQGLANTGFVTKQYILDKNGLALLDQKKLKKDLKSYLTPNNSKSKAIQDLDAYKQTGKVTGYIRTFLQQLNCYEDTSRKVAKLQFTANLKLELAGWLRLWQPQMLQKVVKLGNLDNYTLQWITYSAPKAKKGKQKLLPVFKFQQA